MPRYFLDVHNCSQGRDDIAEEFPNDEALGEKPRASPANSRKSTAGMSRLRFGIKCNRSRSGPAFPDPYQRYRAEIEHALKFVRSTTNRLAPLAVSDRRLAKPRRTSAPNRLRRGPSVAVAAVRWVAASPLQTGRCLCLKRQKPAKTQVRCRGVAQLVEYRSPKPVVAGSSPAAPANSFNDLGDFLSERSHTQPHRPP